MPAKLVGVDEKEDLVASTMEMVHLSEAVVFVVDDKLVNYTPLVTELRRWHQARGVRAIPRDDISDIDVVRVAVSPAAVFCRWAVLCSSCFCKIFLVFF